MSTAKNRANGKRTALGGTRKPRKRVKRSGGQWGDEFRARLREILKARDRSQYWLTKQLGTDSRRGTDLLNTNLPRTDRLRAVCDALDVSADWLLGFDVPPRRSEREPVGELAAALHDYVLAQYFKQRGGTHRYLDGITKVLHGQWTRVEDADWSPTVKPKEPQRFLADVAEWAYRKAEELEEENRETERQLVLEDIRRVRPRLGILTKEYGDGGHAENKMRDELLEAALDPTLHRSKMLVSFAVSTVNNIEVTRAHLSELAGSWTEEYAELADKLLDVAESDRDDGVPRSEEASEESGKASVRAREVVEDHGPEGEKVNLG